MNKVRSTFGIESFYHTIVVAVLAERNGGEAATGELAEASFPLIRIGSFKLVSAVATAIHDNLGRHVGGLSGGKVEPCSKMRWQKERSTHYL